MEVRIQPNTGRNLALLFASLVAAAVLFFWLRELNLAFLATYRILVGIIVMFAGITLGILFGVFGFRNRGIFKVLRQYAPLGFFLFSYAFAGIGAIWVIIDKLLAYWAVAQRTPLNLTALTGALIMLLLDALIFSYFVVPVYFLYKEIRLKRQSQTSPVS